MSSSTRRFLVALVVEGGLEAANYGAVVKALLRNGATGDVATAASCKVSE